MCLQASVPRRSEQPFLSTIPRGCQEEYAHPREYSNGYDVEGKLVGLHVVEEIHTKEP